MWSGSPEANYGDRVSVLTAKARTFDRVCIGVDGLTPSGKTQERIHQEGAISHHAKVEKLVTA